MPIYEYKCAECNAQIEKMQKVADAPLTVCENCGGKMEKQWSLSGFQFKGEGWYVTDYAGKKGEKGEKTDKGDKDGKTETGEKGESTDKSEKSEKSSAGESTATGDSASNSKSDSSESVKKETVSKKD